MSFEDVFNAGLELAPMPNETPDDDYWIAVNNYLRAFNKEYLTRHGEDYPRGLLERHALEIFDKSRNGKEFDADRFRQNLETKLIVRPEIILLGEKDFEEEENDQENVDEADRESDLSDVRSARSMSSVTMSSVGETVQEDDEEDLEQETRERRMSDASFEYAVPFPGLGERSSQQEEEGPEANRETSIVSGNRVPSSSAMSVTGLAGHNLEELRPNLDLDDEDLKKNMSDLLIKYLDHLPSVQDLEDDDDNISLSESVDPVNIKSSWLTRNYELIDIKRKIVQEAQNILKGQIESESTYKPGIAGCAKYLEDNKAILATPTRGKLENLAIKASLIICGNVFYAIYKLVQYVRGSYTHGEALNKNIQNIKQTQLDMKAVLKEQFDAGDQPDLLDSPRSPYSLTKGGDEE